LALKFFKKTSGNGDLTLYLGKRDFVDHVTSVDIVDGVLKVDPANLNGRKVFVYLACAFRYGSEDLDVIGLSCRRDIWVKRVQVFPVIAGGIGKTPMQEALVKKAGEQAHHFSFEMPTNLPCSVALQPGPNDSGKVFPLSHSTPLLSSSWLCSRFRDTCRLMIRKIQFSPASTNAGPKAEITSPLQLSASLGKENYYHGDPISINVKINNDSSKVVKKIKITVEQNTAVVLYSSDNYVKAVCSEEFGETINANSTFEKEFTMTPLLANNSEKRGIAVDGRLKDGDTNLASTTLCESGEKEMQGIIISYKVKVSVSLSSGG
uniref:Arrestin-C n=1 Tax=Gadus morhua TaxID=8049 RepID=A0A8C5B9Y1_GADMO